MRRRGMTSRMLRRRYTCSSMLVNNRVTGSSVETVQPAAETGAPTQSHGRRHRRIRHGWPKPKIGSSDTLSQVCHRVLAPGGVIVRELRRLKGANVVGHG